MEAFYELDAKKQYHVEISKRFTALENLDTEVETIRENIKISAKENNKIILLYN
jgi:hypothetical protein